MLAQLTAVIIALLTIRAEPYTLARHLAEHPLGPYVRAEQIAERHIEAARLHRLPVSFLVAVNKSEGNLNSNARNPHSGARGMPQLLPNTIPFVEWQADCALDYFACEVSSLFHGAQVLRRALDACRGDRACAVAKYRGVAHGRVRDMDRDVVRLAQTIAGRLKQPPTTRRIVLARR